MQIIEGIEIGDMAFYRDGGVAIGAVQKLTNNSVCIYVENAGEFNIPFSAISSTHSHKVILLHDLMTETFLAATRHAHDDEDDEYVAAS